MEEVFEIINESAVGCIWGKFNIEKDELVISGINESMKTLINSTDVINKGLCNILQISSKDSLINAIKNYKEEIEICEYIPVIKSYYYIVINMLDETTYALWFTYKNELRKWCKDIVTSMDYNIYMTDSSGRYVFLNENKNSVYKDFFDRSNAAILSKYSDLLNSNDVSYLEHLKVHDEKLFSNTIYGYNSDNFNGMIGSIVDISSDSNDNTAILGFKNKLFQELLEYVPDYILCADKNNNIIYMNQALATMTNVDVNDLSGITSKEIYKRLFMNEEEEKYLLSIDEEILLNQTIFVRSRRLDDSFIYLNGRYFEITKVPFLDYSSTCQGIITTYRDITKNIYESKELETLKVNFLKNISDSIRTPLNTYFAALQMIYSLDSEFINKYSKYLSIAEKNALRLYKLINNIMELALVEKNELIATYSREDLISYIKMIIDATKSYFDKKNLEFVFTTNKNECIFSFDRVKVAKIILNLLSNSIKFNKEDGKVEVSIICKENEVDISVTDTGIGIEIENFENIFEMFKQVDNRFTKISEGPSIGLALSKAYTEILGGKLRVKSDGKSYSKFTLTLPIIIHEQDFNKNIILNYTTIDTTVEIAFSDIYL